MSALTDLQWREALIQGSISNDQAYASFILSKVSRTFALNIQVLPHSIKQTVLLSYLFCRMADTLEDDHHLETSQKIKLLTNFKTLFPINSNWPQNISRFVEQLPPSWENSENWEHLLIYHCHYIFKRAARFGDPVNQRVAHWVREMCEGMIKYTGIQKDLQPKQPLIQDIEQLEDYCYYVAGTVGHLLSDLFHQYSNRISDIRYHCLKKLSVSFGLGLQMTNILKDIFDDLDRNILFIPASLLSKYKLEAQHFNQPQNRKKLQLINHTLISKTMCHLRDAISYTCLIPRLEPRIRLFCLWPLFMAADTLVLLAGTDFKDRSQKSIKITRPQVKKIIRDTSLVCWSNSLINKMFQKRIVKLTEVLNQFEFKSELAPSFRRAQPQCSQI